MDKYGVSRFERGDLGKLAEIEHRLASLAIDCRIFVVQPGLAKAQVTPAQLELLAVTDLYLKETYAVDLSILTSE
jgi:hypothetical protein